MKRIFDYVPPDEAMNHVDNVFLTFLGTEAAAKLDNDGRLEVIAIYKYLQKYLRKRLIADLRRQQEAKEKATT